MPSCVTFVEIEMNKREFIRLITLAGGAGLSFRLFGREKPVPAHTLFPGDEEDLWKQVRLMYNLSDERINLENGYYNILPSSVLEEQINKVRDLNMQGSFYMRTRMGSDMESARKMMAGFIGCPADELILTRNTTESLDTVISGKDWKPGDEVLFSVYEYGAMIDMLTQQSRRTGIKCTSIPLPLHAMTDDEIVETYSSSITPKTRMILVSHMINITGQILPVKRICEAAREKGVEVMVDGAHAVGHFRFDLSDLGCDYYGSSLHKWLSVPIGAGILWVKKDRIKNIWPLFGQSEYPDDDIRKLNHTGTRPVHILNTIEASLKFFYSIGAERKELRLRHLQQYWTKKVRGIPEVNLYTPAEPERSCAIACVGVEGMEAAKLAEKLLKDYGLWSVGIKHHSVNGCRITPNVYNTEAELDQLAIALKTISGN